MEEIPWSRDSGDLADDLTGQDVDGY